MSRVPLRTAPGLLAGFVFLLVLLGGAFAAPADLSEADRRWLAEVAPLITEEEARIFRELPSEEDRALFKELFWARRDPDLLTPENEVREEIERRIRIADRTFRERARKGSQSDRGRVFVLLGTPARTEGTAAGATRSVGELARMGGLGGGEGGFADTGPASELSSTSFADVETDMDADLAWVYPASDRLGLAEGLTVSFRADGASGLVRMPRPETDEALRRAREAYILHLDIDYARDPNGHLLRPPLRLDPASPAKKLLRELARGDVERRDVAFEAEPSFFAAGPTTYVPLALRIDPARLRWKDDRARLVLFGLVEDENGRAVRHFEERATVEKTVSGLLATNVPLDLPPGSYTLRAGVLDEGSGRWGARRLALYVPAFPEDRLALSSVLVYDGKDAGPAPSRGAGSAFRFGDVRLSVPPSRTFRPDDTVGILYFVYGLGRSPAGTAELVATYEIRRDGEIVERIADRPLEAEGTAATGNVEIPLRRLAPGTYRVDILVRDRIGGGAVDASVDFVLEPEPYALEDYAALVGIYRSGRRDDAVRALGAVEVHSLERAARRFDDAAASDEDRLEAALLHTETAFRTGAEAVHFRIARRHLARLDDEDRRRRCERLWFRAVAHHVAGAPRGWGALPLVREALERYPTDLDLRLAVASVYETMGAKGVATMLERAEALDREILARDPDRAEAAIRLGRVLHLGRRYEEAIAALDAGLEGGAEDELRFVGLLLRGDAEEALGRLDAAVASYRKALELEPTSRVAALALSRALDRSGEETAARRVVLDFFARREEEPDRRDPWRHYVRGTEERARALLEALREEAAR